MFSFSHHLIVQYSADKAGYSVPYNGYALLGDDIVIGDRDVAEVYKAVIKDLGVDFSIPKSHEGLTLIDFAKRLWLRDRFDPNKWVEISPFSVNEYNAAEGSPYLLSIVFQTAESRGLIGNTNVPV